MYELTSFYHILLEIKDFHYYHVLLDVKSLHIFVLISSIKHCAILSFCLFLFGEALFMFSIFVNHLILIEKILELPTAFYFRLSRLEKIDHFRFGALFVTSPKSQIILFTI